MSDTSVSDRSIVRYPEVVAHMTTCATCKAAGSLNELTYNGGHPWPNGDRRCAAGRELDERHISDFFAATDAIRGQVKQLVRQAVIALGVDTRGITEQITEALDEILDETADPKYTEKIRRMEASAGGRAPYMIDDARDDALMTLESLARQDREDDFRTLAQRKGLEHADVLWSAMRFRYLEEC